jgi:hypothetical protein
VANGRPQEAIVVLRAIAKYNDNIMTISAEDVHFGDAPAAGGRPLIMKSKDKKDSELPSPAGEGFDERQLLPETAGLSPDGSSPAVMYDSVTAEPISHDTIGKGLPPRRIAPMRTGSAFYAETPADEGTENHFERAFAAGAKGSMIGVDEARSALLSPTLQRGLETQLPIAGESLSRKGSRGGVFAWWFSWMDQLRRLFVPRWRRTVLLMWVIWGAMSFGTSTYFGCARKLTKSVHNVQCMAPCSARIESKGGGR